MILYPAIDLMDGGCVRLKQGRFDDRTDYARDPADALADYAAAGAKWTHIVDLDGARAGEPMQHDLVARLARESEIDVQVAGGFRTAEQVGAMLDAGAARVVIGSLAVRDPDTVSAMIARFGAERIVLALDIKLVDGQPMTAVAGWTETSELSLWDAAARITGARHLLVTDIGRDGMLAGPNIGLMQAITEQLPDMAVQASGGVGGLEDIVALAQCGVAGAVVGKALWENRFTLAEALSRART